MSSLSAFKKGMARIWLHKRLLVWLYLINILFAAVLVYPFGKLVAEIGKTDLADDFVAGFRVDLFAHYWSQYSPAFKSLGAAALGLGVLYLIVYLFLTGGIVATLVSEDKVSLRRFLYTAGRYFFRFVRLFVLLAATLALVVVGYQFLLADWLETIQKEATTGRAAFLYQSLGVLVLAVAFSLVVMVFDYAKIRTVVDSRRSMFLAALAALGFSVRRCFRAVPLFYLNLFILALLFTIYLLIENLFSSATLASTLGLLAVQQLLIFSRIWMKLSFFASQSIHYQSARRPLPTPGPTPHPATPPEPAPTPTPPTPTSESPDEAVAQA